MPAEVLLVDAHRLVRVELVVVLGPLPGNDLPLNLGRTFKDLKRKYPLLTVFYSQLSLPHRVNLCVSHEPLHRILCVVAVATKDLDGLRGALVGGLGSPGLGDGGEEGVIYAL